MLLWQLLQQTRYGTFFWGCPVVLCVHLDDDQQGAEDTAEEELAPAYKKVEQQLQLEGRLCVELAHRSTRRQVLHLGGVDKDSNYLGTTLVATIDMPPIKNAGYLKSRGWAQNA